MTGTSLNTSIRQRERDRRASKQERDAAERRHDGLCVAQGEKYGMQFCWCRCTLCWNKDFSRCICTHCTCHVDATPLPILGAIPGILTRDRTLY